MNRTSKNLVDLYVYCRVKNDLEFLLLKRAEKKIYSGQWRMIGGKTEEGEARWETALRELFEETRLKPLVFWSVPTINHFYEHQCDRIHLIPAFAAEVVPGSAVVLDDEHDEYRWIKAGEIDRFIVWPEQKRIIGSIKQIVTTDQIIEDWIIQNDPS